MRCIPCEWMLWWRGILFLFKMNQTVMRRETTMRKQATGIISLIWCAKSSKDSNGYAGISSPDMVSVEKEYSASVDPASFVAVRKSVYHLAGSKSVMIKLPASGRIWLDRRMNSRWVRGLYWTTKYWMGHPPLRQDDRFTKTNVELDWINSRDAGAIGAIHMKFEDK